MQLAHPGDDRLLRLFVGPHPEGRVFLGEARERFAEFLLVDFGFRFDRLRNHRLREGDRLEDDRVLLIAERVAGARVGQPDGGGDVARTDRVDVLAMVGVHAQNPADPLRARVVEVAALLERPGVDAEVRQVAVGIGCDLERKRSERFFVVGFAFDRLRGIFWIEADDRLGFER